MTSMNESFFTLLGVDPLSASGASAYNRIEGKEYERRIAQPDEGLVDSYLPVPLYVIAAAALLG